MYLFKKSLWGKCAIYFFWMTLLICSIFECQKQNVGIASNGDCKAGNFSDETGSYSLECHSNGMPKSKTVYQSGSEKTLSKTVYDQAGAINFYILYQADGLTKKEEAINFSIGGKIATLRIYLPDGVTIEKDQALLEDGKTLNYEILYYTEAPSLGKRSKVIFYDYTGKLQLRVYEYWRETGNLKLYKTNSIFKRIVKADNNEVKEELYEVLKDQICYSSKGSYDYKILVPCSKILGMTSSFESTNSSSSSIQISSLDINYNEIVTKYSSALKKENEKQIDYYYLNDSLKANREYEYVDETRLASGTLAKSRVALVKTESIYHDNTAYQYSVQNTIYRIDNPNQEIQVFSIRKENERNYRSSNGLISELWRYSYVSNSNILKSYQTYWSSLSENNLEPWRESLKEYRDSGLLERFYTFFSNGIRETLKEYTNTGLLEHFYTFFTSGRKKTWRAYNEGSTKRAQECYGDSDPERGEACFCDKHGIQGGAASNEMCP